MPILVLLITLIVLPGPVSVAPNQPINPPCTELSGAFAFTKFAFTSETTAVGEGTVTWTKGDESGVGTFSADYFNIVQRGQGIIQLNGAHSIALAENDLIQTNDEIHLQADAKIPTVMHANSRLYIVGGSGDSAGATGLLHTHGAFDTVTLEGSIAFKGQVCTP
ncbi:MAG: hypothetical protein KDE53_01770 [Caldilineaceae bacterium]|nr:hypothetical protein [Caldilineaceae bacterium]